VQPIGVIACTAKTIPPNNLKSKERIALKHKTHKNHYRGRFGPTESYARRRGFVRGIHARQGKSRRIIESSRREINVATTPLPSGLSRECFPVQMARVSASSSCQSCQPKSYIPLIIKSAI